MKKNKRVFFCSGERYGREFCYYEAYFFYNFFYIPGIFLTAYHWDCPKMFGFMGSRAQELEGEEKNKI